MSRRSSSGGGRRLAGLMAALLAVPAAAVAGTAQTASAQTASAQTAVTLYVSTTGTSSTGCTDPNQACATIQEAIDAAGAGGYQSTFTGYAGDDVTIDVAPGTYTENDAIDTGNLGSLTIAGTGPATTTINGGGGDTVVMVASGTVTITGLTITNGNGSETDLGVGGGGVVNYGTLTLSADSISGNTAAGGYGGGVYNLNVLTMTGDTLSGDTAMGGGAVLNDGTNGITVQLTMINDTLTGDNATNNGGAVMNQGTAQLSMINDTLTGDNATGDGGGVFATTGSSVYMLGDTLAGNTAKDGAGIAAGAFTLADSILDQSGSCILYPGGVYDGGHNVESDNSCGLSAANGDVVNSSSIDLASSLGANGSSGPQTLSLGPASSALDVVPAADCKTIVGGTDERGDPRPGISGQSNCDAGAFELQGTGVAPQVTSAATATFAPSTAGSFTVTTDTATFPTPTLSEIGSLDGLSFTDNGDGTAAISGTPTATGSYPVAITAANGIGTAATQSLTIVVGVAPTITSPPTAYLRLLHPDSFTVTATGAPTATLAETGALPEGLTFTANGDGTATISGTPGLFALGTHRITLTATNGIGTPATQTLDLVVGFAPGLIVAPAATFTVGRPGQLAAASFAYPTASVTETGGLPTGLSFADHGDGLATITGTPQSGTDGAYTLTLTATNPFGTATRTVTLTVRSAPGDHHGGPGDKHGESRGRQ